MFMTAWGFEACICPTLLNEIKKTKLQTYTSPQAGINILLVTVWPSPHFVILTSTQEEYEIVDLKGIAGQCMREA
jgi:hypothetical protein